jgi:glycosyltransferase involved in cell wall biosynthesis
MHNLLNGISVLICTYNGSKNLEKTLQHLAKQEVNNLSWEIIFVDNASTDNSTETAVAIWEQTGCAAPLLPFKEFRKGKDRAIDLGLSKCHYKYVIICDDDNWLCDTYLETSYRIMKAHPEIGILGGKSVPVFEVTPPEWFRTYESYYAVGAQNIVNGEIFHYWPRQRFLWGAGSVINMEAYLFLKRCGFERILTAKKYPNVCRSEDIELCFAIWLTGYKLWYDSNLILQHLISADRLQWSYFMKLSQQSLSSLHYLRPYKIFAFTGEKYVAAESLWFEYIKFYLITFLKTFRSIKETKMLFNIITGNHSIGGEYMKKAFEWYQISSVLRLGKAYDKIFHRVANLKRRIDSEKSQIARELELQENGAVLL